MSWAGLGEPGNSGRSERAELPTAPLGPRQWAPPVCTLPALSRAHACTAVPSPLMATGAAQSGPPGSRASGKGSCLTTIQGLRPPLPKGQLCPGGDAGATQGCHQAGVSCSLRGCGAGGRLEGASGEGPFLAKVLSALSGGRALAPGAQRDMVSVVVTGQPGARLRGSDCQGPNLAPPAVSPVTS